MVVLGLLVKSHHTVGDYYRETSYPSAQQHDSADSDRTINLAIMAIGKTVFQTT